MKITKLTLMTLIPILSLAKVSGNLQITNQTSCQITPAFQTTHNLLKLNQKDNNELNFEIEFDGLNMARNYSLPFQIECNQLSHVETIHIKAISTAMEVFLSNTSPNYAEAHFVIDGDNRLDAINKSVNIRLVSTAINQS